MGSWGGSLSLRACCEGDSLGAGVLCSASFLSGPSSLARPAHSASGGARTSTLRLKRTAVYSTCRPWKGPWGWSGQGGRPAGLGHGGREGRPCAPCPPVCTFRATRLHLHLFRRQEPPVGPAPTRHVTALSFRMGLGVPAVAFFLQSVDTPCAPWRQAWDRPSVTRRQLGRERAQRSTQPVARVRAVSSRGFHTSRLSYRTDASLHEASSRREGAGV